MKIKDLQIKWKKNLLRALVSATLISIYPFYIYGFNFLMFIVNFTIIFPGVFIGCTFVDLIMRYFELKKEAKNK